MVRGTTISKKFVPRLLLNKFLTICSFLEQFSDKYGRIAAESCRKAAARAAWHSKAHSRATGGSVREMLTAGPAGAGKGEGERR